MEVNKETVFKGPLEGIKLVKESEGGGQILTKPFLDLCRTILPVLDKFGPALSPVKSDIEGNISRLEKKYLSNPTEFNHLYSLIREEVASKTAKSSSSCTNALLWLTRAMEFLIGVFDNLQKHPDWSMSKICTNSYDQNLKKWHNWLATSSFTVALKLAPDRKKFVEVIGGSGDLNSDIDNFCSSFMPLLQENHEFLASVGLDNLKV